MEGTSAQWASRRQAHACSLGVQGFNFGFMGFRVKGLGIRAYRRGYSVFGVQGCNFGFGLYRVEGLGLRV